MKLRFKRGPRQTEGQDEKEKLRYMMHLSAVRREEEEKQLRDQKKQMQLEYKSALDNQVRTTALKK